MQDGERLLALYRPDLLPALEGLPDYRRRQVFAHMMRPGTSSFAEATTLPADLRTDLDGLGADTLRLAATRISADGTKKLLYECRDGRFVETVVMPYRARTTACVSSQAGCPVGCAFCATGAAGFERNLTTAEIVDQVRGAASASADSGCRLSNVVYMGMGEPLLNLRAVLDSIKILTDSQGMDLAHRSISVSTVGIPAGIVRLGQEEPQVNLALSLHAASDDIRASLIPARHRHPLKDVLAAAWRHFDITHRKLMVEYVLLHGVNDSPADARRLASLLRGHVVTVNLLSWNRVRELGALPPTPERPKGKRDGGRPGSSRSEGRPLKHGRPAGQRPGTFSPSPREAVIAFRDALQSRGIEVTVRRSRGADIEGACGQLAGRRR